MQDASPSPEQVYRERRERFGAARDRLAARWSRVANLRLIAFVAAAAAAAWAVWGKQPLGWALAALALIAFVALLVWHRRLGAARGRAAVLHNLNAEALARLARDWNALPPRHRIQPPPGHPYAVDLDIFGRASLMQLLDSTETEAGERTLADWLLAPAAPPTVLRRQEAVRDLASRFDLRQEMALSGRLASGERRDPEPFLEWAEGEPWLARRPWLRVWSWLGPALLLAAIALQTIGSIVWPLWIAIFIVNILVAQGLARPASSIVATVGERSRALASSAGTFALLAEADFASPAMRELQASLSAGGEAAPALLRRLGRIAAFPLPPSSPLWIALQGAVLWDIHVLAAFERWQAQAGAHVRRWLATLGEIEALAALAGLAFDEPRWAMPELDPTLDAYRAKALGHPLLPDDVRVANDVTVGPPETFLLVTGSNMSGKSTLLRAIGVNAVLAAAGGPVCAQTLSLPPVELWTSVRIQDSLEQGVSFFLAELQRLKLVLDAARRAHRAGSAPVLYLLDEILQGTNTAERQVAARRIIADLVAQGAIGAVSTHDLALADAPELAAEAVPVHFTDLVGDGVSAPLMSFDYRLRPGVATTTNALRLMNLVGFDGDVDGASAEADRDPEPNVIERSAE
jgi:ABC-type multidrug transport system fused ATPase/permease subunit